MAAKRWNADVLGVEPYFERAELDGRIIGPDDPDYQRASLGYVEFRIGDCQHELDSAGALGLGAAIGWVPETSRPQVAAILGLTAQAYVRTLISLGHPT